MNFKKQHLTTHNFAMATLTRTTFPTDRPNKKKLKHIFSFSCFHFKKIFLHLFHYENIINIPYRRHDSPSPGCEVDLCAREFKMFVR